MKRKRWIRRKIRRKRGSWRSHKLIWMRMKRKVVHDSISFALLIRLDGSDLIESI